MTKLENKLLELGYSQNYCVNRIYEKFFNKNLLLKVDVENLNKSRVYPFGLHAFYSQQDIDNLQQAFNQLQNDLKELSEYEQH